jgi:MFS family permease
MSNVGRMTIISFILFMSLGVTGPVSSLYVASLGANYVEIGLLGTVTSLTVIVFGFVWGQASDHCAPWVQSQWQPTQHRAWP